MGNANEVRETKGAPIELGGETRYLKYDLNAFAEIEEMYGDIEKAMSDLEKGSIKALRAILWAGMLHNHLDSDGNPTLTMREVGSWIDFKELPVLSDKIGKALEQALPTDESQQPVPFDQTTQKAQKTGSKALGTGPQSTTQEG